MIEGITLYDVITPALMITLMLMVTVASNDESVSILMIMVKGLITLLLEVIPNPGGDVCFISNNCYLER